MATGLPRFRSKDFAPKLSNLSIGSSSQVFEWMTVELYGRDTGGEIDLGGWKVPIPSSILAKRSGRYYTGSSSTMISFFRDTINEGLSTGKIQVNSSDSVQSSPVEISFGRKTMNDIITDKFYSKRARGDVIMSPMESTWYNIESYPSGDTSSVTTFYSIQTLLHASSVRGLNDLAYRAIIRLKTTVDGIPDPLPTPLRSWIVSELPLLNTHSYQNAVNSAFGNIDEAILDVPVMIGEAKSTYNTVVSGISRILNLIKSIKSGNFRRIAPKTYKRFKTRLRSGESRFSILTDLFSDAWLEARYAIRPIVIDIENSLKLLNGASTITPRQTFRGYDLVSEDKVDIEKTIIHGDYTYRITGTLDKVCTSRAGALCELRLDTGRGNDFGLFNITTTFVELIPLSFIFQWFFNIGGFLRQFNPNPTYRSIGSWASRETLFFGFLDVTVSHPSSPQNTYTIRVDSEAKDRKPNVEETFISIDVNLDISKIMDLILITRKLAR